MENFVKSDSVLREIWGDTDCILFIFGACAGEFALHKSVDWLFFTNKLPSDPLGRLFSTVVYAQKIIFEEKHKVEQTITMMNNIHKNVEKSRGYEIPNWAYQDVLYMLIANSITSYELLYRPLKLIEKEEVYSVFREVGILMFISDLPVNYSNWLISREKNLKTNYQKSRWSIKLELSYQKNLGSLRYRVLKGIQNMLLPAPITRHWKQRTYFEIKFLFNLYQSLKKYSFVSDLKYQLLPEPYRNGIRELQKYL
jgi:hypothetical protein